MNNLPVYQSFSAQLLNSMIFYVVVTDVNGKCLLVNPLFQNKFSYLSTNLRDIQFVQVIHGEDINLYEKAVQACIQAPTKYTSITLRINKPSAEKTDNWIKWEPSVLKNEDGSITGILYIGHDIVPMGTDNHRLYQPSKNVDIPDNEKFRTLVNHIPGAIYRCLGDADLTLEFFSEGIEKLTGYPSEYFVENNKNGYSKIVCDADRELVRKSIRHAVAQREKFEIEYRIVKKNGELRWVFESGQGIYEAADQVSYVDGCIFDITDRKRTEAALAKSEDEVKRLALVAHNTTNSVMITDSEEHVTWVNSGFTRISGYSLEEVRGKKFRYFLDGPQADIENQKRIHYALNHRLPFNEELMSNDKTGEIVWFKVDCQPLFDENAKHLGFMAIANDITRNKLAQKQQEELVQRLSLATDSAEIGIWEIDLTNNHVIWDDRMYAMYGYSANTQISLYKIFNMAVHPDDAEMMAKIIRELLCGKKEIDSAVYRILLPDGSVKFIESHAIIKKTKTGKIISLIGTNRDITDDILVQEKIKSQNKVLREIAFIQSHEVRRPLANILGVIEILKNNGALNDLEIFDHLVESANDLDMEIRSIVNKTNNIDDDIFR